MNADQQQFELSVGDMRADRLITLGLVDPIRSLAKRKHRARIPILMYHSISKPSITHAHPYYLTETDPQVFRAHMSHLKSNGYYALTPQELLDRLRGPKTDDRKAVFITFDDGYRDFFTGAFPILEEHGFTATVYLPTQFISSTAKKFIGKECLTWQDVRELRNTGIVFGSHSVTHSKLYSMAASSLRSELRNSKDLIEQEIGESIDSFAYPYAFPEQDRDFVRRLSAILEECGYATGVSTLIGSKHLYDERLFLKRLPVNSFDDTRLFSAKLDGSYDWLYWPQHISKLIKSKRYSVNI